MYRVYDNVRGPYQYQSKTRQIYTFLGPRGSLRRPVYYRTVNTKDCEMIAEWRKAVADCTKPEHNPQPLHMILSVPYRCILTADAVGSANPYFVSYTRICAIE